MNQAQNRVFRIERINKNIPVDEHLFDGGLDRSQHSEIMAELAEIKSRLNGDVHAAPTADASQELLEKCQRDLAEAQKIRGELQQIHEAIAHTKQEIATLHRGEFQGVEIARMTNELSAIVEGTEQATENILHAAEAIDNDATDLVAALKQSGNHALASDIQDQVIKIFEACNFQDLTGQRISKVVTAFTFIEERVNSMMEIWGGLESFKDVDLPESCTRTEDEALLNGPALEEDENIASQDDIDALFD